MRITKFIAVLLGGLLWLGFQTSYGQPSEATGKTVTEDYYPTGVIKYKSITRNYGASEFGVFKKTKVWIWEYYENGNPELVQRSAEKTATMKRNQTTGEPMNKLPVTRRRYKRYDRSGALIEKGWETPRKSKNVLYDVDVYSKIITKKNQQWQKPKIKKYERERAAKKPNLKFLQPNGSKQ